MNSSSDNMFAKYQNMDFADAKPVKDVPALARLQAERGRGQRGPQRGPRKISTTIRFTPEVLLFFQNSGPGWQTRIDAVLTEHVRRQHETGTYPLPP